MSAILNFKYGNRDKLKANSSGVYEQVALNPGTVYVTRDEHAIYVDLPSEIEGGTPERIRIGDLRIYNTLSELYSEVADHGPAALSKTALYYVEKDVVKNEDGSEEDIIINALMKWTGNGFIRLNNINEVSASISNLQAKFKELDDTVTGLDAEVGANSENIGKLQEEITALKGDGEGSISDQIDEAVEQINGTIESLATKEELEAAESTINDVIDGIGVRVGVLEEFKTTSEANISQLQSLVIGENSEGQTIIGKLRTDLDKEIKDRTDEVSRLESLISANTEDIGELVGSIDGINTTLGSLETTYLKQADAESTYLKIANAANIYATKQELETAKSDLIGTAETELTDVTISGVAVYAEGLKDEIDGLDTRIGANASNIAQLTSDLGTANNALNDLTKTVSDNKTDIENKLSTEVARAEEAEKGLSNAIDSLTNTTENLDERLDTVELFFDEKDVESTIDTLREVQQWIDSHEDKAGDIIQDINDLKDNKVNTSDFTDTIDAINARIDKVPGQIDDKLTWGTF